MRFVTVEYDDPPGGSVYPPPTTTSETGHAGHVSSEYAAVVAYLTHSDRCAGCACGRGRTRWRNTLSMTSCGSTPRSTSAALSLQQSPLKVSYEIFLRKLHKLH